VNFVGDDVVARVVIAMPSSSVPKGRRNGVNAMPYTSSEMPNALHQTLSMSGIASKSLVAPGHLPRSHSRRRAECCRAAMGCLQCRARERGRSSD